MSTGNRIDSRPCRKDRSRVDVFGRAYAGSQRQIQTYVNEWAADFAQSARQCLGLSDTASIRWVSPLREHGYTEYRDADFLRVLGIGNVADELRRFWPLGGPCWDALGCIEEHGEDGILLVEAKSQIREIYGQGCYAKGRSLVQIQTALHMTKAWLGVDASAGWTGGLYQSANRYAHLYFFRCVAGIRAYLMNVYFVGDPHSPTRGEEWEAAIRDVQRELGISNPVPFSSSLFLPAFP